MPRGRKPRPTAQKRLDGNPGKRPLNDAEPAPPPLDQAAPDQAVAGGADADQPAELDGQPVAIAEWHRLVPMLRRCRQVTEADRAALVALCLEWDRYLEARGKAHPRVVASPSGYAMPNPWLSIQTKALTGCLKLWAELGLTPSSRSRVKMSTDGGGVADEFSEFDKPLIVTTTNAATKH